MNFRIAVLSMLVASVTAPAPAAQPAPRQPTGQWVAEFADDMCILQRNYGTAEQPLTLAIYPDPASEWSTLYVLDPPVGTPGGKVEGVIGFGTASETVERQVLTFDMSGKNFRRSSFSLKREDLERAVASGIMSVAAEDRLNVAFQVPALAGGLRVLDECVADLLDSWGFSREQQQAMATPAVRADPDRTYIEPNDYPQRAIIRNEMGINSARYTVQSNGRTSNCTIVETSSSTALDRALCRAIGRMRYRPALDKNGEPMDSIEFLRIQWWLG